MKKKLTYAQSGVDYEVVDPAKILAQQMGKKTTPNLPSGFKEIEESRGESAYVVDAGDFYLAFTQEGLGTKNLVADSLQKLTGKSYYDFIAQDTVAAIINDLVSVGATPLSLLAYWAVGNSSWLKNKQQIEDLVKGWADACQKAGVVWGGGETPILTEIINQDAIDLAGSAVGIVKPKNRLALGDKLKAGDVIIFFESSGIHANGLTLARKVAEQLPDGYLTKLSDGKTYGETLLVPTIIYAKLIQDLFEASVDVHYMVHITGHGWRKLMRNKKKLTYRINAVPPVPGILTFIQEKARLSDEEVYSTFNMGAGFAVFVSQKDTDKVLHISEKQGIKAYSTGVVESGEKQVIIAPKKIVFKSETLQLR